MHPITTNEKMSCTHYRRCVGCLKLQVSFHTRDFNYRAILQKGAYKDKESYGSSPPCTYALRIDSTE